MKVLLYGINFWPELTGCGKYSFELAEWLTRQGHVVEVCTAQPYYPQWRIYPGYFSWKYSRESIRVRGGEIDIYRCPLWIPVNVSALKRLLHLASFALMSVPILLARLRRRPDLLFIVLPTISVLPVAIILGRLFGSRIWIHVQDFEVDASFGLSLLRGRVLQRVAVAVEGALLRAGDRVSSISQRMVERLCRKGVVSQQSVLLPNWVDIDYIFPMTDSNEFRRELGLAARDLICLYSGVMSEKQGLEIIVEAATLLRDHSNVRFLLVGSGVMRGRLEGMCADLPNVTWLPLQPLDRLNALLNVADVHLLPQRADAADLVMPSKLTGMLASGRPVLGTARKGTQLGDLLDALGVRCEPGHPKEFADGLMALASDLDLRTRLGQRGRRYAEDHLAVDRILERFVEEAKRCCEEDRGPSRTHTSE